MYIRKN